MKNETSPRWEKVWTGSCTHYLYRPKNAYGIQNHRRPMLLLATVLTCCRCSASCRFHVTTSRCASVCTSSSACFLSFPTVRPMLVVSSRLRVHGLRSRRSTVQATGESGARDGALLRTALATLNETAVNALRGGGWLRACSRACARCASGGGAHGGQPAQHSKQRGHVVGALLELVPQLGHIVRT